MHEKPLYFEDFPVGQSFPLGPMTVKTDEILAFAREFDPQPMHLDEAAGEASLLGGLAASGWHSASMMMRMMADSFILRSRSQGAPGIESMEWKRPVLAGDVLTGTSVVEAARPLRSRPGIGIVTMRHEVFNQNGDLVVSARNPIMFAMAAAGKAQP